LDFAFGVFLHAHVQSLENDSGKVVFRDVEYSNSVIDAPDPPGPNELTNAVWKNWLAKHRIALYDRWLRELPEHNANDQAFQAGWPAARDEFLGRWKEYETNWGGWYWRHNGEVQYIGDHIVHRLGEKTPALVLLGLLAGLTAVLIKHLYSTPVVRFTTERVSQRPPPKRRKRVSS
jgi:hypothetical protein